jgi:NDP-sugar pyrophosphorylase family protein
MAGAAVGEGARLCDAVVMEGGSVGAGATVDHSVVGPRARVGPGASLSALTVVGEGQVVSDGRCLSGARIPGDA